eukprot:CAMPEP_0184670880 /NCGR_PEP_ID=MMETSP0308-20130426/84300_1 /TAXON_ID=38269 /ORGANISM="Gloeochaete witrockiana, Strain SAG 46.84" /LENGTH=234 /DNA_ID=CAMNT_0027117801 /DNA_START=114 /DNA_END=818 /DNA_ORIENTATION=-
MKVVVCCGYSPVGISHAVALLFGSKGFSVALLARSADKLSIGVAALSSKGIKARAFPVDLGVWDKVKGTIEKVRAEMGEVTILFWNAYAPLSGNPFTKVTEQELIEGFNVHVSGLISAVQATLNDLKAQKSDAAILVTGGALELENETVANLAVDWGAISMSITKASQRKAVHLLNKALARDGVFAGMVTVANAVKGTAFDPEGKSPLTPEAVAEAFGKLYEDRATGVWNITKA